MRVNFRDPATGLMEGIIDLHHSIFFYLIIVVSLVAWMLANIVWDFYVRYDVKAVGLVEALKTRREHIPLRGVVHGRALEIVWTITPALILVAISVPSFALLYSVDELVEPVVTVKAVGNQWYWNYEYSDYESGDIEFDSYMLPEEELTDGKPRLLEVDRKVWLPSGVPIRVIVTASDVLHCWAVPALGIKMDGVPGRLNQVTFYLKREGIFYGQCSEICGVNHGFMPIAIKSVPVELYNYWVEKQLEG